MSANHTTPDLRTAAILRARRDANFEPELTAAEIEAENLVAFEVATELGPLTFYRERDVTCPACAAGHHEQPALGACDCVCHGHITPKKPADYQRRFLDDVEASTLPLRTRRAA